MAQGVHAAAGKRTESGGLLGEREGNKTLRKHECRKSLSLISTFPVINRRVRVRSTRKKASKQARTANALCSSSRLQQQLHAAFGSLSSTSAFAAVPPFPHSTLPRSSLPVLSLLRTHRERSGRVWCEGERVQTQREYRRVKRASAMTSMCRDPQPSQAEEESREAQLMQEAEEFMRTLMDARAAADAMVAVEEQEICIASAAATEDDARVVECVISTEDASVVEDSTSLASSAIDDCDSSCALEAEAATTGIASSSATIGSGGGLTLPAPLCLTESDEPQAVQWNLISPWSEADDEEEERSPSEAIARAFFKDDGATTTAITPATVEPGTPTNMEERLRQLIAAEEQYPAVSGTIPSVDRSFQNRHDRICEIDDDEDDEEFEVFNVNTLVKAIHCVEELFEEKLDSEDAEDCTDGTRTSVGSTLDDSCEDFSPRPSAATATPSRWGRIKAHTYTGTASASMQSAYAKLRSRTLSTTTSFRSSSHSFTSEMEDDGDFSSDDEGYSKDRVSNMERNRRTLVARLSNASKMSFLRFRSSSSTTTTSEESFGNESYATSPFHTSSFHEEAESAPASGSVDTPLSQNQQQMRMLKLKASACASKAATYLNAASTEAARKIKSKTFRVPPAAAAAASKSAGESEEEPEPWPMSY